MGVHGLYRDRYIIEKYQFKGASSGTYRNLAYKVYGQDIHHMYNSIFIDFYIVCEGCTVDKFADNMLINLKILADPQCE